MDDSATVGTGGVGDVPPRVSLLAGRAAFVAESRTLLVADLHLGKAATFRRAGIPVPEGSAQSDLARLGRLLESTAARRLLVLGDLLHAAAGCTPAVIGDFRGLRDRFAAVETVLVLGNHDRAARGHASALGLDACLTALDEPPFRFVHDAADAAPGPLVVAGHVHPRVVVGGRGGDRVAERCFHLDRGVLTLPAFGSFTGGERIAPTPSSRVWAAGDDAVIEVTRLLRAPGGRRGDSGGARDERAKRAGEVREEIARGE